MSPLHPLTIYAADPATSRKVNVGVGIGGQNQFNYKTYVLSIYDFSMTLGTSLAVLMIIYAGYKYLTSQGNSTAINDAKEIILGAVLGLALLFLVKLILAFIGVYDPGLSGVGNPI